MPAARALLLVVLIALPCLGSAEDPSLLPSFEDGDPPMGASVRKVRPRGWQVDVLYWELDGLHNPELRLRPPPSNAVDGELLEAVCEGDADRARDCLGRGANADLLTLVRNRIRAPLHIAAEQGDVEMVKLLLQAGADTGQRAGAYVEWYLDLYGRPKLHWTRYGDFSTPLHLAAESGHVDVVTLLLQNKAQPNLVGLHGHNGNAQVSWHDKEGVTPLHLAARAGQVEAVKLLLADPRTIPNPETCYGSTPLYWAVGGGHKDAVAALLAEPRIKVNLGRLEDTPLRLALRLGYEEIAEMLRAHGAR